MWWLHAILLFCLFAPLPVLGASSQSQPSGVADSVIRIATSADGVEFKDSGVVLIDGASHADIVRLNAGELLAVFEKPGNSPDHVGAAVTCSKDDGKSWLRARQIRISGLTSKDVVVSSPELVAMPNGLARLYFVTHEPVGNSVRWPAIKPRIDRMRSVGGAVIRSAVTRDGVEYRIDPRVYIPLAGVDNVHLSAFWTDKQLILLASIRGNDKDAKPTTKQWTSNDARTFVPGERVRFDGEIGHVLRLDRHHWRMYAAMGGEVRSRMSNDGVRWRDEAICMRAADEPSVAPLGDKLFLMLYSSPLSGSLASLPQLALPQSVQAREPRQPGATPQSIGKSLEAQKPEVTPRKQAEQQDEVWQPFTSQDLDSEIDGDSGAATESSQSSAEFFPPKPDLRNRCTFAPPPDFINRFDYMGWFEQNLLVPNDQNAYSAYGPLLSNVMNAPEGTFQDMYNGGKYKGPPGPWLPSEHPDWEASYQATQDFVSLFRAGSADTNPFRSPLACASDTTGEECLVSGNIMPTLGGFRRMTRAVLSQAWRAENGQVSPENMRSAFETCLSNANHLQQGTALLERLVAAYERKIVQENARWALKQNVFTSAEDLESVLDTLRQKDLPAEDPVGWVSMEQTWAMNLAQYVMVPQGSTEEPAIDPERLNKAMQLVQGQEDPQIPEGLLHASKEDAVDFAEEVTNYYQKVEQAWRASQGGPLSEGTDRLAEEISERNPAAGSVLASGDRAYELILRTESGAKATQLAYCVELFRIRNGRYPASLEELPADEVGDARTDPYNGGNFVYRLTDNGPMIYSLSRNGRDDGGSHYASWGDQNDPNASDDYVFWPPQE